jgi:hypothetical protein
LKDVPRLWQRNLQVKILYEMRVIVWYCRGRIVERHGYSIIFVQLFKKGFQPEAGAGPYLIVATTLFMFIIITKHKRLWAIMEDTLIMKNGRAILKQTVTNDSLTPPGLLNNILVVSH